MGLSPQPPVDIVDLAYRLGVSDIRTANLVEDGRLDVSPKAITILVRPDLSPARRRFTIAHEIAHLLIGHENEFVARREGIPDNETERTCDQIAAGLLLPYRWIQDSFSNNPQSLETVREVVHGAQVSMGAALVRMKEVLGWHLSLLRWRHVDRKWRFVAGAGTPPGLFGAIRTAQRTNEVLDSLRASGGRDARTDLPVMIGARIWDVPTETSVWSRTALALADLVEPAAALSRRK